MHILIIEDEPRAARQLENMLKAYNFNYQILGILDSVEESIAWFNKYTPPDLVFMDIQLADGLSFEIFQTIKVAAPIIFTTAFDQYAIQAFKVNSVDYLLKPIQQEDLQTALDQFNKTTESTAIDPNILKQLLTSMQQPTSRDGILVKDGSGLIQINISNLLYCYSEESIIFGVVGTKRYIIDETIDQLYNSLDPDHFFKINRGQVIKKSSVQKIEPYFNHRVKLTVATPRDQGFIVSRQRTSEFKDWMNR